MFILKVAKYLGCFSVGTFAANTFQKNLAQCESGHTGRHQFCLFTSSMICESREIWKSKSKVTSLKTSKRNFFALSNSIEFVRSFKRRLRRRRRRPSDIQFMELFSRRRWRLESAQLSNKFDYCPSCLHVSLVLAFHNRCSSPLGQILAFISR